MPEPTEHEYSKISVGRFRYVEGSAQVRTVTDINTIVGILRIRALPRSRAVIARQVAPISRPSLSMPPWPNLDMDALRTFVAGIERGSFATAASRIGRSPSAVSAQLRKLEQQVGVPLVHRSGRGLAPTIAGQEFLSYARRILALNDEAISALRASEVEGWIRLGVPPDFGDAWLQGVLAQFSSAFPRAKVEVHVDQSPDLIGRAASGHLDLALSWIEPPAPMLGRRIAELAASWIAAPGDCEVSFSASNPVRLVTANAPCAIRAAAIATLDQAHIPWQIAVATPQLAGVWSAVGAGMGITLRPTLGMPPTLITIKLGQGLPPPPRLPLYLIRGEAEQVKAVRALTAIMTAAIETLTVTSEL